MNMVKLMDVTFTWTRKREDNMSGSIDICPLKCAHLFKLFELFDLHFYNQRQQRV